MARSMGAPPRVTLEALPLRSHEGVRDLVARLAAIPGVAAVALGGSHARGRARPDSDVDLGVYYAEAQPFAIAEIRALAEAANDRPGPVVSDLQEWGPWVDGGAWLTVGGGRVDLLYRSFERLERTCADAEAGRYEVHWAQQPPFGYWSGTQLGELAICEPLFDRDGRLAALKRRVEVYPEALRRAVVADQLWQVDFGIAAFARKLAERGEVYPTAGCLTRFAFQLVLALFACNRAWLVNDKTAIAEVAGFEQAPRDFGPRVEAVLARPGATAAELSASVEAIARLWRETTALCGGYEPRYLLP